MCTVMALALAATPVGMLLSGSLISTIWLAAVLLVIAVSYLATTVEILFNLAFNDLDSAKVFPVKGPAAS